MPIATVAELLDTLRAHSLLEGKQLAESLGWSAQFADPKALARELLSREWLTAYQANLLLQGRGPELLLGPYILLERIGEGGMGQVFKAKHRHMKRIVAVKVIHKERLGNEVAVKRFYREMRAAAQLDHPNVVHAFDADQIGNNHILVMEYVEGTDLSQLVKTKGPLPIDQARDFLRQAALGLHHAHERGLVHRDIKPSNFLLAKPGPQGTGPGGSRGGTIKLADLGLARVHHPDDTGQSSSSLTADGAMMGSLDYLAPEQAMEAHTVDIRADLYGLGCTFYYLLSGQVPFPGSGIAEKMFKHRFEEPKPVRELRPEAPAELADIVAKLMAKQPEDRYQTPAELLGVLGVVVPVTAPVAVVEQVPLAIPMGEPPAGVVIPVAIPVFDHPASLVPLASQMQESTAAPVPGGPDQRAVKIVAGLGLAFLIGLLVLGVLLKRSKISPAGRPTSGRTAATPRTAVYVRKATAAETILETLRAHEQPTLEGKWHYLGPFDNTGGKGFAAVYPPGKIKGVRNLC